MAEPVVDFRTEPGRYRHWRLDIEPPVATLTLAVDPNGGLRDDYELKTNSYDLGVDVELYDAVQRLRFEHPSVKAVILRSGIDKVFSAGANIQMLASASHGHKVNFCKFTNETRNGIEDATRNSRQTWIAAVEGTAAGGGYELALACEEIVLVDDRATAVSLPELPLLAVLPGTGGLTRLVDKRLVRRDLADVFATKSEGIRGALAVEWGLVDRTAPSSTFDEVVRERALASAQRSDRPDGGPGVPLPPLERNVGDDAITYTTLDVQLDRDLGIARFRVRAPEEPQPATAAELLAAGEGAWLLRCARELDDAVLHLRFNEPELGSWVFQTHGSVDAVADAERVLGIESDHWLVREVRLYWARVLTRLDLSARSLVALIEPGSCYAGLLAELALGADRSYMLDGTWEDEAEPPPPAVIRLSAANDGWFPMSNGLSRLATRFWGRDAATDAARGLLGKDLDASEARGLGLVTFTPDDLDWADEVRLALEERNGFSPDALTGLEASLRFVGPETMETKIFGRLSAWQNWIFQRENAAGADGALQRFGTGSRAEFDRRRV